MNNKKLKEEFIKYFGEEKWNEEEILSVIQPFTNYVCESYLGLSPVPVLFDDLIGEASRYSYEDECIYLNRKYKDDMIELLHSTLHEIEHYFQGKYAYAYETPKALRWRKDIESNIGIDEPIRYQLQEIEIDANAFAAVVLSCELGITYIHPIDLIQAKIEEYISSNQILNDD